MQYCPQISIITVCFNAAKYIEKTIQSVINQTYTNIEYIIIDGASKDNTVAIIQQYLNKIAYFISEPDKSLYDAMNKGLAQATGDYVLFLNAGDCLHNNQTLTDIFNAFKQHADFIYGNAVRIQANGSAKPWHKTTPNAQQIKPSSFAYGMVVCHNAMLVRRTLAPPYKLWPYKISSDLDWTISILKKANSFYYYDAILCDYLDGGLSARRRWRAVYERLLITTLQLGPVKALWAQLRMLAAHIINRH